MTMKTKDEDEEDEDEDYVSCDVDSLFTNIPVQEASDYIIHQVCRVKTLSPIYDKTIFKRLSDYRVLVSAELEIIQTKRGLFYGRSIISNTG